MDSVLNLFEKPKDPVSFDAIRIRIASPHTIRAWSSGEVKKPETINYRTFKPERDGLFCAVIFGPVKDYECLCGKYKRMKYRGVVCEKCGVEVISSKVRRERLGHIELASPVSHVWFFKGLPSRIGNLLDMTLRELERILYFENYVVVDPGKTGLKKLSLLTEEQYRKVQQEFDEDDYKVGIGAEAIRELLVALDLDALSAQLKEDIRETSNLQKRRKLIKRLKVADAFRTSGNRPEWMILEVIPVLPPELRPLVPLDGGRFATSDLNDLYRRVINRNNRLMRLQELKAPDIIIRNEKRMLQEAVDALFDNGRRGRLLRGPNRRPLKSLSDMLKGKQGRFRQNLLGKRVDYSGRSVIVIGPELKFNQCGLPKKMALELFKPFIYNRLEEKGLCATIKAAKKMVEEERPEVWDVLEEVVKNHPVILNRAPTLHRLGMQAFMPLLVEGKAIRIHPLVCAAFNADFDGDQMAVHVPLSVEAVEEARVLMLSANNILSPANGMPLAVPSQDIILGCYYLTKPRAGSKGEGRVFSNSAEARVAYDQGEVGLQARIRVRLRGELVETTIGRVLLHEILPENVPFEALNRTMDKKALTRLVAVCYENAGRARTVRFLDDLKNLGFSQATQAGISISIDDMKVPDRKRDLIELARKEVLSVESEYRDGLITDGERYNKIIDIWSHVTEEVSTEMFRVLETEDEVAMSGTADLTAPAQFNPIYIMADSGARGSTAQLRQLGGMRGLMAKPSGEIIETPITANFREGLSVLQYFISTHGARKGLADTALKTANSGYLTRRLVDVAQDIIITEDDCGTLNGIDMSSLVEGGEIIQTLGERVVGRIALQDIKDAFTGEVLCSAGREINEERVRAIENAGVERVTIRSVLTCEARTGVCAKCYGRSLATGLMVEVGEAVGVIAAQSIGEPGTQLTMRTFHIGGTATRASEQSTVEAKRAGFVKYIGLKVIQNKKSELINMNRNGIIAISDETGRERERYPVVYGAVVKARENSKVSEGEKLLEWDPYTFSVMTERAGHVSLVDVIEGVTMQEEIDEVTGLSRRVIIDHADEKRQPRAVLYGEGSEQLAVFPLPAGAHMNVNEDDSIQPGDVIFKITRETSKTKDITGGLPRVAELFEARKPKENAVISEINGTVKFAGTLRGMRRVLVVSDTGDEREYLIPRGKHVNVQEGDYVRAGEPLMDGAVNPHDILAVLGEKELQNYLVNEVQEVYRLQGVNINDKHIEVIVRQMLRRLEIIDPGDTDLVVGEQVTRELFHRRNQEAMNEGKRPATGRPILLGITRASLSTDSFISAASFQETTRVLTQAAVSGKVDYLRGLKENVIMGRLIPAGTGARLYQGVELLSPEVELAPAAEEVAAVVDEPDDEEDIVDEDEIPGEEEEGEEDRKAPASGAGEASSE
ncbi:MAG: DNA-directed RNA polymerase subunit beta' [Candidatus Tectomicrobia bacterium]|uniref:DNA-directed RNA polymerase subunit beta' n=1 Tax=Tectimicrobiota bacterium TaxID=2528274 RepID=A0A932HYY9_UNCTE|nr:DNA-directed RNA polymerase subunit beta' [Candidatus Tectomicrobia bacterium]